MVYELTKHYNGFTLITENIDDVFYILKLYICDLCLTNIGSNRNMNDINIYDINIYDSVQVLLNSKCGIKFSLLEFENYDDYYENL